MNANGKQSESGRKVREVGATRMSLCNVAKRVSAICSLLEEAAAPKASDSFFFSSVVSCFGTRANLDSILLWYTKKKKEEIYTEMNNKREIE